MMPASPTPVKAFAPAQAPIALLHVPCLCGLPQRVVQNYEVMTPTPADNGRDWRINVTTTVHSRAVAGN